MLFDGGRSSGAGRRRSGWSLRLVIAVALGWVLMTAAAAQGAGSLKFVGDAEINASPTAVALSPDGKFAATANILPNSIAVYSTAGGVLNAVPGTPFRTGDGPASVAFSPDGQLLAVANGRDDQVTVYQVAATGRLTRAPGSPVDVEPGPYAVAFTPDGAGLVSANTNGTLSVFSVGAGGQLTQVNGSPVSAGGGAAMAISPDGKLIATAGSPGLSVFEFRITNAGVNLIPLPGSPLATGAQRPTSVAFNPAGSMVATANSSPTSVSVFALVSDVTAPLRIKGSPFANLGPYQPPSTSPGPTSVAFSPDGQQLAATTFGYPPPGEAQAFMSTATFFSVGQSFSDFGQLTSRSSEYLDFIGPVAESHIAYSATGGWFAGVTADRPRSFGRLVLWSTSSLGAQPGAPSSPRFSVARRVRTAADGRIRLTLRATGAGTVGIRATVRTGAHRRTTIARRQLRIVRPRTASVTVRPDRSGRALIARRRSPVRIRLVVTYEPERGLERQVIRDDLRIPERTATSSH